MGRLLDAMVGFFRADDWNFTEVEGKDVLRMGFSGDNGQWTCFAQAREQQEQFVFYSICPVKAPEEKRPAVAELLTRANYGLVVGNFELDYSDGEVRYKTSIAAKEGETLTPGLIKHAVYANVLTMDRYLPGIMSVLYSDVSPADAIAKVEG
jgi:hypothetical protein